MTGSNSDSRNIRWGNKFRQRRNWRDHLSSWGNLMNSWIVQENQRS